MALTYPVKDAGGGNEFQDWQGSVLTAGGFPVTKQNEDFLTIWHNAELSNATYNPLNTTQTATGASDFNSVGVKNYPDPSTGTYATAQTLTNGYYPTIVAALKSGNPAKYILASSNRVVSAHKEISTWGTNANSVIDNPSFLVMGGVNAPIVVPFTNPLAIVAGQGAYGATGQGNNLSVLTSPLDFLNKIFGFGLLRSLEVVAGVLVAILGLYLLARQVGLSPPTPPGPLKAAASAAESAAPRRQGDAAISRGEEVTRASKPRPRDNVDRRLARRNERNRERDAASRQRELDERYGEIPF